MQDQLISPAYLAEMRRLHEAPRGFGTKGAKWAGMVQKIATDYGVHTLLDYGCGQGGLLDDLRWRMEFGHLLMMNYDPAVPAFAAKPMVSHMVVCTDVLEHVEEKHLEAVLDHLAHLTQKVLFVVIGLTPTDKTLSDGRQAHITLKTPAEWAALIGARMRLVEVHQIRPDKQWVAVFVPEESRP